MNILTEEQAAGRQLAIAQSELLDGLPADFSQQLQTRGAFVEYNQQVIVPAGAIAEYVSCIVAGRVKISRVDADYAKTQVATLTAGHWFGETNLFLRVASRDEVFADGEVVLWTIPPDTLRQLFFEKPEAVQLLFNIGTSLAQKLVSRSA
ncbi:MAG: cyclic nucleotide-binding domain-containing protein [Chthoniobacterales bacterium]|nr:cyclic nucleotide-binding domain-containing protein [Chthoniobacterales bacterium]